MKLRKSVAAASLAVAALFVVAGCSEAEDAKNTASSAVETGVSEATSAAKSISSEVAAQVAGLSNSDAQEILDKATNPESSDTDLDEVLDTSNAATKPAMKGFAAAAKGAGYTFTVTNVSSAGDNKATVKIAVKSPHIPMPGGAPLDLTYVKVDGKWKLSAESVNSLAAQAGAHGGGH